MSTLAPMSVHEYPLIGKLKGFRETGTPGQFQSCCPGHDDSNPSLSISLGVSGKLMLTCHGPCSLADVLKALNCEITDLFPSRPKSKSKSKSRSSSAVDEKQIVGTYDYCDAAGNLLYQVVRCDPKDFRQRRPKSDGRPGWVWSVKDALKVPYRLPELLASAETSVPAAASPPPIFIVEGEKDVDNLRSLGLVATCNAGGAGKWLSSYGQFLKGRHIVILPDNDEAGRKHANSVAKTLAELAKSIKVLELPELPEKGDASDWLKAGGTLEKLQSLTAAAPAWEAVPDRVIKNFKLTEEGTKNEKSLPRPMTEILHHIWDTTGNWPRRVGDSLFVADPQSGISWLGSTDALFGWLGTATGQPPRFTRSPELHTRADVFQELKRQCESYLAIESVPHFPPIAGHFYNCETPDASDGSTLQSLIERYSPETEVDADLIKAMFATTIWGGPGGSRPAFIITSDEGRGEGKQPLRIMWPTSQVGQSKSPPMKTPAS